MRRAVSVFLVSAVASLQVSRAAESAEPCAETARQWWPPLTNAYTPVGWKNHVFRFNVFYNGMVLGDPRPEHAVPALDRWNGLGVQLGIMPSEQGEDPYRWRAGTYQMTTDSGRRWSYQGLLDRPTPVVWTEWRQSFRSGIGYVLREEVFAHVPGGKPIETGTEPLFAWIRMSVSDLNPIMDLGSVMILVRVNKPHIFPEMSEERNCALRRTDALYPRKLAMEMTGEADRPGCVLVEPDGRIRLGVRPGEATAIAFRERSGPHEQDMVLNITIPARKGAFVDLLVPMLPEQREIFARESETGRERALAECDAYWSTLPATAAVVETPEPYVNELVRRNAQYGELIAQRMPDSGLYTNLTGSWVYARMWATPTTMFDTMLLDTLGYHEAVGRYLEIFRATQGTVKPPGPAYDLHPGYFATPKSLTSIDWLSDHGAVLHAVCYHALLTDDRAFIDKWIDPILKACDFIRESRSHTNHAGVHGVIPPAVATDQQVPTQAVWNVGWHYRGLTSALRLLERLGRPEADAVRSEAEDFCRVFVEALREQTKSMPVWTDSAGRAHHLVPTSVSTGGDWAHPFYLDTGPLFLVYAGLLPADDPLMQSTLAFFREGPNHAVFDPHGHYEQPAILVHEISSCEPCSSFNLFHSHQLGDRARFLEGMYSMLAGAHSQQTYIACESRGGITGLVSHMDIYALRLCAVDDLIEPDALHLLRMTPLAWLKPGQPTRFENVPTVHGPVSISFEPTADGSQLDVRYEASFHHAPKRIVVHAPPLASLKAVVVNGQRRAAKPGDAISLD